MKHKNKKMGITEDLKDDLMCISEGNADVAFLDLIINTYNDLLKPTGDFTDNANLCTELYDIYTKMHSGYEENKTFFWWKQIFRQALQVKISLEDNEMINNLSEHEIDVNIYIVKLSLFAIWLRMFLPSV